METKTPQTRWHAADIERWVGEAYRELPRGRTSTEAGGNPGEQEIGPYRVAKAITRPPYASQFRRHLRLDRESLLRCHPSRVNGELTSQKLIEGRNICD
jgi:hypothetical protein